MIAGFDISASLAGAFSFVGGRFVGMDGDPSAWYEGAGVGLGFPPAAGAALLGGFFTGDATQFAEATTLYAAGGVGLGVEFDIFLGSDGTWGLALGMGPSIGSPLTAGWIFASDVRLEPEKECP